MSRRVAIVGANGRIGVELSLRLHSAPGLDVVAVCRNAAGSACLRMSGIECRLGDIAAESEAPELLDGCDVVVQLAYRAPRSRAGYQTNRAIARNCVVAPPRTSHTIAASTISVYAPDLAVRIPDAYGMEKLYLERVVRESAAARGHQATVLRIGHTLGELQPQTHEVIAALQHGLRSLPDAGRRPSNTVFVAMLADAVVRASNGDLPTGTFDLVTFPQWTWADVFGHYASQLGIGFRPLLAPPGRHVSLPAVVARLRGALVLVPEGLAERMYGWRLRRAAVHPTPAPGADAAPAATNWRGVGRRYLPGLISPDTAVGRYPLEVARPNEQIGSAGWSLVRWDRSSGHLRA